MKPEPPDYDETDLEADGGTGELVELLLGEEPDDGNDEGKEYVQ